MSLNPVSLEESPKKHSEKSREADPLELTTTGALLLQSLLRLHAPHNTLVLDRCARGGDSTSVNSDCAPVVSNRCHLKVCSPSRTTLQLPTSSTPSSTARQSHRVPAGPCSAPWRRSSRTSSTTASVPELARAVGRRRIRISRCVTHS